MDRETVREKNISKKIAKLRNAGMKQYTCTDYRQEMILLGLKRRLADAGLDESEKKHLEEQIRKLETEMGMI